MKQALCLIVLLSFPLSAFAELRHIKILNPDGTPAVDAKAVAIMTPGARVDQDLKELPSLVAVLTAPATAPAKNDAGTIAFDSKAKAIVAQNENGFVFALANAKTTTVKLRPWCKLEIDTTKASKGLLESHRISVRWENCFAGNAFRPVKDPNDPFGQVSYDQSGSPVPAEPTIDWRFDPIVMWTRNKLDKETTFKVPPGEVTVVLSSGDFHSASASMPIPRVLFRPIRTMSNSQAIFALPSFGSISGKISPQMDLPDWNQERDNVRYLRATPSHETESPEEVNRAFAGGDLDALASFYGSEKGSQFRSLGLPEVTTNPIGDDDFLFEFIPEGTYRLEMGAMSGKSQLMKYKADTEDKPLKFTVSEGVSTTLDLIDKVPNPLQYPHSPVTADNTSVTSGDPLAVEALASENLTPRDSQAVIDAAVKRAEQKIAQALIKVGQGIDYQATPLLRVMQDLEDVYGIPIRVNKNALSIIAVDVEAPVTVYLPAMTLRSTLRNMLLSISEDLTFTIRDEVLLITSKEDAADEAESLDPTIANEKQRGSTTSAQNDTGKAFIDQWLKTSSNEKDPQALRKALQFHLEQQFDANQKSRQTELERLRVLLKQSEDWVATRQAQRAEIVRKRLEELLKLAESLP